MVVYIDFDGTIFDTAKFKEEISLNLSQFICSENKKVEINAVYEDLLNHFDGLSSCVEIGEKYNISAEKLKNIAIMFLQNSSKYIFDDAVRFFEKYKGTKFVILSYSKERERMYQTLKIKLSKIESFVDEILIVDKHKGELEVDYKNSIFIDDRPKELESIYKSNPAKVYRIIRDGQKYSKDEMNIEISSIHSFDELNLS